MFTEALVTWGTLVRSGQKLGQVISIEFRQPQINFINAKTVLNNATFDAKLIELQLLQLSGDILNVTFLIHDFYHILK